MQKILLIDDNETDSEFTRSILEHIGKHPRVTYLSQGGNYGVSSARNYAIKNAKENYIAFLDDDDEWEHTKIENQLSELGNHPEAGLIFGLGVIYDVDTGIEEDTWQKSIFNPNPSFSDMLQHDYVGSTSIPLISMDAIRKVGGFRNQPAVEDYDLWIRISKHYPIYGIDTPVYIKHMMPGEHVSMNHKNTFIGYKNIYESNKGDYKGNDKARKWILYNIMREGIKAKTPRVIPYCFAWLFCNDGETW